MQALAKRWINTSNTVQYSDLINKCLYETDTVNTGLLLVDKLDTISRIVAGSFNFTVVTQGCDTIKITEGRFDVKY